MRSAIANDLPVAVEVMRRVIASSSKHEVVWIARDGAEAVAGCLRDRPDLVLMDLLMPVMDGVEATRRIMAASPCPILVVTATVEGNAAKVFEAMGAGALDVVQTPALGGNPIEYGNIRVIGGQTRHGASGLSDHDQRMLDHGGERFDRGVVTTGDVGGDPPGLVAGERRRANYSGP